MKEPAGAFNKEKALIVGAFSRHCETSAATVVSCAETVAWDGQLGCSGVTRGVTWLILRSSQHTQIFLDTHKYFYGPDTHTQWKLQPWAVWRVCLAACNPSLHAIFNKMLDLGFKQNGHGRCVHDKGLLQQFISGYYPRLNTINHLGFKQRFAKISQSRKRTLLGPYSGWKHILAHLKLY